MHFTTIAMALGAALGGSAAEMPPEAWNCRNQVEVWCAADGCAASDPDEMTPMDVWAHTDGKLSVCAYTGCWESEEATVTEVGSRVLWTADGLPFTTGMGGSETNVTLLIDRTDGVGFVRAVGLAPPVLCERVSPGVADAEQ